MGSLGDFKSFGFFRELSGFDKFFTLKVQDLKQNIPLLYP